MHRDLSECEHLFVGKTVERVDFSMVNVVRFWFADGSRIAIEVASVAPGISGMVACDDCTETPYICSECGGSERYSNSDCPCCGAGSD